MPAKLTLVLLMLLGNLFAFSQDSTLRKTVEISSKFVEQVNQQNENLDKQLSKKVEAYTRKLIKEEDRLKKHLDKFDSVSSKVLFSGEPKVVYESFLKKIQQKTKINPSNLSGEYQPYVDSLNVALSFLKINPSILSSKVPSEKLQNVTDQIKGLQSKIQNAEELKQFIQQRKEQIRTCLSKYSKLPAGLSKVYKDYNIKLYYYSDQIKSYKDILNNPDKQFNTALMLLNKLPAFTEFAKKNSLLAGLFTVPNNYDGSQPVQGLATRDQVMASIQQQSGSSAPNVNALVQKNTQTAMGSVDQLKDKIAAFGASGGDMDMPDFKPNNQKVKTFLSRIEYGTNLQTAHSTYYFPITTDIGLSAGYRLNKDNIVGIGMAYKVGWGSDIKHINLTSEGVSLRSFVDLKIKKSFFVSGGLEYNYQQPFDKLDKLKVSANWQKSGLIGISKIVTIKSGFLKKSKVQLLWDVLSYWQVPQTQPLKFRVGYSF